MSSDLNIFRPIRRPEKVRPFFSGLVSQLSKNFAGPTSYFHQTVEEAVGKASLSDLLMELLHCLDQEFFCKNGIPNHQDYQLQWNFLKAYVNLRLNKGLKLSLIPSETSAAKVNSMMDLMSLLKQTAYLWQTADSLICESKRFVEDYSDLCSQHQSLSKETWTYPEFVFAVLLQNLAVSANLPTERTPITLATLAGGYCIELVGQRIPGPANWIVPNWFRMGLVHLGPQFELCRSINQAMFQISPGVAIQWWLEVNRHRFSWHSSIDGGEGATDSATVPAACVARALAENVPLSCRPLIDDSLAASGKLFHDKGKWLCESVTGLVGKVNGARDTSIRYFVFPSACETQEKNNAAERVKGTQQQIVWLDTFDGFYGHLLKSSDTVLLAKRKVVDRWNEEFVEVETHSQFYDASERSRSFKRDNATKGIGLLPDMQSIDLPTPISLDEIFEENGKLKANVEERKSYFLVRQPFWYCDAKSQSKRWEAAKSDQEPEIVGLESGIRPPTGNEPDAKELRQVWRWITRNHLVGCAVSEEPTWQHLALVCGPGLGKTTNFKYLAAAVNRHLEGRCKWMAIPLEISELHGLHDELQVIEKLIEVPLRSAIPVEKRATIKEDEIKHLAIRLYQGGRILFLLDSLDQADHRDNSEPMKWIETLIRSSNKVWITGRPYAFVQAQESLSRICKDWQIIRVGQLDEPEARQLIETGPTLSSLSLQEPVDS